MRVKVTMEPKREKKTFGWLHILPLWLSSLRLASLSPGARLICQDEAVDQLENSLHTNTDCWGLQCV